MNKFKGAAILGALVIAGLSLFSSLPASGGTALTTDVARRLALACPRGEDRPLCRFVASMVQFVDSEGTLQETLVRLRPAVRLGPGERNCDGCLQAMSDIEAFLATNGTPAMFQEMIAEGCDRFRNPSAIQDCQALAQRVPQTVDRLLADLPPGIICGCGQRRPFSYCGEPEPPASCPE
jgi:hypothetical protein